jgi:hypothetical protein
MEYYSQTSLDEYYTLDEHLEGETVGKVEGESVEQSIRGVSRISLKASWMRVLWLEW